MRVTVLSIVRCVKRKFAIGFFVARSFTYFLVCLFVFFVYVSNICVRCAIVVAVGTASSSHRLFQFHGDGCFATQVFPSMFYFVSSLAL